jgi:hypothetical protein
MAESNDPIPKSVSDRISGAFKLPKAAEFENAFNAMQSGAIKINKSFGQTKQRIVELQTSIADTAPKIVRLGGNIDSVVNSINEIALASRRNVIANDEDVSKMFAASQILGQSVEDISNDFLNVGVGISQIPEELTKSINYIQSIGGNVVKIMDSVDEQMGQMNRYQFEGGVQGLTKMAAQASMLRFDMKETFSLAEKVLTPEGAIEVASAFQRLGVSAGSLVDPFSLMNQSINDPSGLQTSLANVSRQFTFFDEKTKTFKISHQGVLTLREMEKAANISTGSLSKMGLAAAEMDRRISEVNAAGITFGSEEDKQYLQNIASMGKGGKYEVTLKDGTIKELRNLNQEEFDELIDEQKKRPKDLEGIARAQMTYMEVISADVKSILVASGLGAASQKDFLQGLQNYGKTVTSFTGIASNKLGDPKLFRTMATGLIGDMKELFSDLTEGVAPKKAATEYFNKLKEQGIEINKTLKDKAIQILEESRKELNNDDSAQRTADKVYKTLLGGVKGANVKGNQSIYSLIEGTKSKQATQEASSRRNIGGTTSNVNVNGGFKIDVNFNGNGTDFTPNQKEEITKMLVDKFNNVDFQQLIVNITTENNPTKSPVGKVANR